MNQRQNKQLIALKKAVDILNEAHLTDLSTDLVSSAKFYIHSKEEFYSDRELTTDEAQFILSDYEIPLSDRKQNGTMPDWISNENYNISGLKVSQVIELHNKVIEEAKKALGELSEFRVCRLVISREENPCGDLVFFVARKKQ